MLYGASTACASATIAAILVACCASFIRNGGIVYALVRIDVLLFTGSSVPATVSAWVPVNVPPRLSGFFGEHPREVWLPALIAGWLTSVILLAAGLVWSMYYVWRRRQYEALIARLERELARLRNLPFTDPAPLEDLPERPNAEAARVLAALDADAAEEDRL